MADSNITVAGLEGTSGTQQIKWEWTYNDPNGVGGLPYLEFDAVEVWTAALNNRNSAAKAGEGITDFVEPGLTRGEIRYGWIRARNRAGGYGDWFPAGVANGIEAREASGDVLLEENGYWHIPNGLIHQWGYGTCGAGIDAFVFPRPFPNQCLNVVLTPFNNNGLLVPNVCLVNVTPTGFETLGTGILLSGGVTLTLVDLTGALFSWQAKGY